MAEVQDVGMGSGMSVIGLDRDEQALAYRRLMSAVIITAIRDGCTTPPKSRGLKEEGGMPISTDAFTAMRFLFDTSVSGLAEYLAWFDIDAGQYRVRLKDTMFDNSALKINGFETFERRNFRFNYNMWMRLKDTLPIEDVEGENDA